MSIHNTHNGPEETHDGDKNLAPKSGPSILTIAVACLIALILAVLYSVFG